MGESKILPHGVCNAILGPEDTPYQGGGVFKLEISIPGRYPLEPPQLRFLTPLYYPNVDKGGRICLDILKPAPHGSWKPSINISSVLTSLQVLLSKPNPDDPLVPEIANQFRITGTSLRRRRRGGQRNTRVRRKVRGSRRRRGRRGRGRKTAEGRGRCSINMFHILLSSTSK